MAGTGGGLAPDHWDDDGTEASVHYELPERFQLTLTFAPVFGATES